MAAPPTTTIANLTGTYIMVCLRHPPSFPPRIRAYEPYLTSSQSKTLSDPTDAVLALQGVGWLKRKAINLATVTLSIKQYVDESGVTHVDIDQTATAARERVRRHVPDEAERLLQGRFRIINVWRPLNGPVLSNPLAFASSNTVRNEDVVPVEHRYPDRTGYTASILYNEEQRWNYLAGMKNNERILLECFDSEGEKEGSGVQGGRVPHTAFKDPRTPVGAPGRESIEVRTLVFGP